MFEYKGEIVKVVDADTIDVMLDLGFSIFSKQRFRLARINAPEMSTDEGKLSKEVLIKNTPLGTKCTLKSLGKDRYGRYIGEVYTEPTGNLSDWLLINKLAKAVDY